MPKAMSRAPQIQTAKPTTVTNRRANPAPEQRNPLSARHCASSISATLARATTPSTQMIVHVHSSRLSHFARSTVERLRLVAQALLKKDPELPSYLRIEER